MRVVMGKELKSLADYAQAATKALDDLLGQGFSEAQVLDLVGYIEQEITIRTNVRAWDKESKSPSR